MPSHARETTNALLAQIPRGYQLHPQRPVNVLSSATPDDAEDTANWIVLGLVLVGLAVWSLTVWWDPITRWISPESFLAGMLSTAVIGLAALLCLTRTRTGDRRTTAEYGRPMPDDMAPESRRF